MPHFLSTQKHLEASAGKKRGGLQASLARHGVAVSLAWQMMAVGLHHTGLQPMRPESLDNEVMSVRADCASSQTEMCPGSLGGIGGSRSDPQSLAEVAGLQMKCSSEGRSLLVSTRFASQLTHVLAVFFRGVSPASPSLSLAICKTGTASCQSLSLSITRLCCESHVLRPTAHLAAARAAR